MGKKTKLGKQRRDKFYHLAKETGYRSRAAFKLVQLNRKYEFLQKSRVLVDLCAAPGGWMQVAVQNMPVSSVVIGVDLFPIKSIPGCIAIQEDITTPKCLQLIKKELQTWKADVVLHDGAPNVGQNWIQDAYQQNCLTLGALKVATNLLRGGGYFVTKVFRSKDYNSLIWIFQQLFRHVYSTKPAASRTESAEIFVVCKGYLAPHSIDPKFLDPKYAFEDVELPQSKKQLQQLLMEVGKKKKAEGYSTTDTLLYKPIKASTFVESSDHIELLANTGTILMDEEWIEKNPKTTEEIKEYCKDVKVLGKKEIRALVNWRKELREKWDQFMKIKTGGEGKEEEEGGDGKVVEEGEESDTETKLEHALHSIREEQRQEEKRKKKKLLKEIKKIQEKTSLEMIIPGDTGPTDTMEDSLFSLKGIKSRENLESLVTEAEMPVIELKELDEEEELEFYEEKRKNKIVRYNKAEEVLESGGRYYKKINESTDPTSSGDEEQEQRDELDFEEQIPPPALQEKNKSGDKKLKTKKVTKSPKTESHANQPSTWEEEGMEDEPESLLLKDLDPRDKSVKRVMKAERWFANDVFKSILGEDDAMEEVDEDVELKQLAQTYIEKGAKVPGFSKEDEKVKKEKKVKGKREEETRMEDGPVVKVDPSPRSSRKNKLDVEGLALASLMIESKKSRRDLMDEGWNRYCFNDKDQGLPDWFVEDEKKHMKKTVPVPPHLVEEYQQNLKEIHARPIKKVMEAKARQKKRVLKKLEKAKKKTEAILEKGDLTDQEKANQIKQLYKKAKQRKKKEVTYVVTKKFQVKGKRMKRPAGVKGPMKVVDPRMKKDNRRLKANSLKTKGKKGRGGRR